MLSIDRAFKSERLLKALTGLSIKEFANLLYSFSPLFDQWSSSRRESRKRAEGAGRKWDLEGPSQKLFFLLFYVKVYPTFDVAGFFFDVDRSRTNRWVHAWMPLLEKALGEKVKLPERKIQSVEEFLKQFPEVKEILIDGTERPIQRPKNQEKQKENYSGKKKRHTRKNLIITDKKKRILVVSPTVKGSQHDYQMLKDWDIMNQLPNTLVTLVDLGFQGIRTDFPEHQKILIPQKKPKKRELNEIQKAQNTALSSLRVVVEHAIGGIKRLKSLTDTYRNRKEHFDDQLMMIGCGIWNYHLAQ